MTDHFIYLVLFAFFVSTVFAVLVRDDPRHQLQFGGMLFGGFIAFALVVGWVLYLFPL
jgi:hypothetical protein